MVGAKGFKYWILQQKFYFDKGLGLIGYLKYIILGVGFAFKDVKLTLLLGALSGIALYFLGLFWTKFGMTEIEMAVSNQYNPFVKDTLKHLSNANKFEQKFK